MGKLSEGSLLCVYLKKKYCLMAVKGFFSLFDFCLVKLANSKPVGGDVQHCFTFRFV